MKFDHLPYSPVTEVTDGVEECPRSERPEGGGVQVGDLYPSKGRRKGYWLVVSIIDEGRILGKFAVLLGLDMDYNIVSGVRYGVHSMQARELLGWVDLTNAVLIK